MRHAVAGARTRGLTLVEVLMVVAIVGLIMAVLIVYLMPSDDRRVKLEAERMAAYLEAAGAEAIMRDAPVRVAYDFEAQTYDREVARIGADLHEAPFEDDPGADRKTVRAPVRLAELHVPGAGDLQAGQGWLLWKGRDTEGGVAVLALNEAVWSVIVDPNNGQVRIERGRAGVPSLQPLKRGGVAGSYVFPDGGITVAGGNVPSAAGPGGTHPGPGAGGPGAGGPGNTGGQQGAGGGGPGAGPGGGGNGGNVQEGNGGDPSPAPESEPPPEKDAGATQDAAPEPDAAVPEVKCTTDEDCRQLGPMRRCLTEVADQPLKPEERRCILDPSGQTFRLALDVQARPEGIQGLFDIWLAPAIQSQRFNLIIKLDRTTAIPEGDKPPPMTAYVVQGVGAGGGATGLAAFAADPQLPTLFSIATPKDCLQADSVVCYGLAWPNDNSLSGFNLLTLWLPTNVGGQCPFIRLSVRETTAWIEIRPAGNHFVATMMVEGVLTSKDASTSRVRFDGVNQSLKDILVGQSILPNHPSSDGVLKHWKLAFTGEAQPVEVVGGLAGLQNRVPNGCTAADDVQ